MESTGMLGYVRAIFGASLMMRDGRVITDAVKRTKQDYSVRGKEGCLKRCPLWPLCQSAGAR
jgi:hypothetical protein